MRYACMLMLALLIVAGPGTGRAEAQTTWRVPSVIASIATAVDTASAGDLVLVSNNQGGGNPPYAAFTMKTGVRVAAEAGQSPRVAGTAQTPAVIFPATSDSQTILEGFRVESPETGVLFEGTTQSRASIVGCTIVAPHAVAACTGELSIAACNISSAAAAVTCAFDSARVTIDDTDITCDGIALVCDSQTAHHLVVKIMNSSIVSGSQGIWVTQPDTVVVHSTTFAVEGPALQVVNLVGVCTVFDCSVTMRAARAPDTKE